MSETSVYWNKRQKIKPLYMCLCSFLNWVWSNVNPESTTAVWDWTDVLIYNITPELSKQIWICLWFCIELKSTLSLFTCWSMFLVWSWIRCSFELPFLFLTGTVLSLIEYPDSINSEINHVHFKQTIHPKLKILSSFITLKLFQRRRVSFFCWTLISMVCN